MNNKTFSVGRKRYRNKIIITLFSFVIGIILFISLVNYEKNSLSAYKKCSVVIAKQDIAAGQKISSNQLDSFFKQINVNSDCAVEGFKNMDELKSWADKKGSLLTVNNIKCNEMIYSDKFLNIEEQVSMFNEPVIVGVRLNSYEYCIGGKLRSGDVVDLSVLNLDMSEDILIENILVLKAFDVNGIEIMPEDDKSVSIGFNVVLEKSDYEMYENDIENGTIKLTRKITG